MSMHEKKGFFRNFHRTTADGLTTGSSTLSVSIDPVVKPREVGSSLLKQIQGLPRELKKAYGFTLIELMIGIAIVGILAGIAYPSYVNYINRSNRADALATLSQMQLILERCYSQNFSYSAPCTGRPAFPLNSPQNFYTITLTNLSPTTYTLTATPQGVQIRDTLCTNMSVNQANVRTAPNEECWGR